MIGARVGSGTGARFSGMTSAKVGGTGAGVGGSTVLESAVL